MHLTGLMKPNHRDAKIKFLAGEALRGVGGLVFDAHGSRFANELGWRDYATGERWKNTPSFPPRSEQGCSRLAFTWHCRQYTARGVMKLYESGTAVAQNMGVPVSKMEEIVETHFQASLSTAQDPDGGLFPHY